MLELEFVIIYIERSRSKEHNLVYISKYINRYESDLNIRYDIL